MKLLALTLADRHLSSKLKPPRLQLMLTETFSSVVNVISEDKPFPDGQESCLATEVEK